MGFLLLLDDLLYVSDGTMRTDDDRIAHHVNVLTRLDMHWRSVHPETNDM